MPVVIIIIIIVLGVGGLFLFNTCSGNETPEPVNITIRDEKLTWEYKGGFDNAISYPSVNVTYNGKTKTSALLTKSVDISDITVSGNYTFSLQATGAELGLKDSKVVTVDFYIQVQTAPMVVSYNNTTGTFTWNSIYQSSGYEISIDTSTFQASTNSYSKKLNVGTHTVKVKTLGNGQLIFDSDYSNTFPFTVLSKPTNLYYLSSYLYWDAVPNASTYIVYRNNVPLGEVNTNSYQLTSLLSGDAEYKVVAKGDNVNTFDSDASAPLSLSLG